MFYLSVDLSKTCHLIGCAQAKSLSSHRIPVQMYFGPKRHDKTLQSSNNAMYVVNTLSLSTGFGRPASGLDILMFSMSLPFNHSSGCATGIQTLSFLVIFKATFHRYNLTSQLCAWVCFGLLYACH